MDIVGTKEAVILLIIMLWVLPWKGYALWTAAKLSHRGWFIFLLVVNTLAIVDIIYIFFVSKKERLERMQ